MRLYLFQVQWRGECLNTFLFWFKFEHMFNNCVYIFFSRLNSKQEIIGRGCLDDKKYSRFYNRVFMLKLQINVFCACTLRYFLIIPQQWIQPFSLFKQVFLVKNVVTCEVHRVKYKSSKTGTRTEIKPLYIFITL